MTTFKKIHEKSMVLPSHFTLVLAFCLCAIFLFSFHVSHAATNLTAYNRVKQLEGTFPFPAPEIQIDVGYFDVSSGKFVWSSGVKTGTASLKYIKLLRKASGVGLRSGPGNTSDLRSGGERLSLSQDPVTGQTLPASPSVVPTTVVHFSEINAVNAVLKFGIRNVLADGKIVVNGKTYTVPKNSSLSVKVGTSANVNFSISGTVTSTMPPRTFTGNLIIKRPAVIGAGAFTIPALPIAILYDPPQDNQLRNYAKYSETAIIGLTLATLASTAEGSSSPTTTEYQSTMALKDQISQASGALSQIPNPYAQAASAALGLIAGGLGSADATEINQVSEVRENSLVLKHSSSMVYETIEHLGPGLGDMYVILKNARIVWLGTPGKVKLALLGWDSKVITKAKILKEDLQQITSGAVTRGPKTGWDRETLQKILEVDPFAFGGQNPQLPAPRFQFAGNYEFIEPGACVTGIQEDETTSTDLNAKVNTSTRVENYSSGYLSFAGLGVTQSGTVTQSQTYGTSKLVTQGTKLASDMKLCSVNEMYDITLYRDTLFNVFAAKLTSRGNTSVATGTARDALGVAIVNKPITLTIGGKKFTTFTNAQGQYSFRSSLIPTGEGIVKYGATVLSPVTVRQLAVPQQQLEQTQPSGGFTLTPIR